MNKSIRRLSAADLLRFQRISVTKAVSILKQEPDSPVTRALKLWGDDENPFRHLIASPTAEARIWRRTMAVLIMNLKPDRSRRTVWRGWYFETSEARERLLKRLERTGRFVNRRTGMSASRSRAVALRPEFINRHGALWEIRRPRTARDLAPVFRAIGAKYPWQREVIFPRGSRFKLVRPPLWLRLRRGGQTIKVRHYLLQEMP